MTVAELIAKLEQMPQDVIVRAYNGWVDSYTDVEEIELKTDIVGQIVVDIKT